MSHLLHVPCCQFPLAPLYEHLYFLGYCKDIEWISGKTNELLKTLTVR